MDYLKKYFLKNFENFFVLVILVTVAFINYFIPQKLAFLNFYFLPIILAGYYLGAHKSLMGALLCIILIFTYSTLSPEEFIVPMSKGDMYFYILVWGGFLIISGGIIGTLHDRLRKEINSSLSLEQKHKEQTSQLEITTKSLIDQTENFESKIHERTRALESSKKTVEEMKNRIEKTLETIIDPTIARLMTEGKIKNEFKDISLMNIDMSQFHNNINEKTPGNIINDFNNYYMEIEKTIRCYKGHLDKFTGNSIMCSFGTTLKIKNYKLLAALCALSILEKSKDFKFKIKISIVSENVLMGLIGSSQKTLAPLANIAKISNKMIEICPLGKIIIDENTRKDLFEYFEIARLNTNDEKNVFSLEKSRNFLDTKKLFIRGIYENYEKIEKTISFPEDLILPIEAIEGNLGHSKIVSALSYALATKMELSKIEKQEILYAAYVSEIGKESIPPEALDNFDELSDDEKMEFSKQFLEAPNILKNMGYTSELMLDLLQKSNQLKYGFISSDKINNLPLGSQIIYICKTFYDLEKKVGKNNALIELKLKGQEGTLNPEIVAKLNDMILYQ